MTQSLENLLAQQESIAQQIEQARNAKRQDAIQQAKKIVHEYGLTAKDLGIDKAAKKSSGIKVAAKYRDQSGNAWSGRGKMPKWLSQAVAGGKKASDFAI